MISYQAGDEVGHYRILREIGQGGMGAVYEADDLRLDRVVALKIIAPTPHSETDLQRLKDGFEREAKLAAGLNHPNLVTVYALEIIDDHIAIVLEFVAGESLDSKLTMGVRWSALEAASLLLEICRGVTVAHDAGIIHRDLKPGNIMILPDGRVKVLDFGVARQLMDGAPRALHDETAAVGTVNYMAPEQVLAEKAGPFTDVFALGAVGYELVTGELAFGEGSPTTIAMRVTSEDPPLLSDTDGIFGTLASPLRKALAKDPRDRFSNASEFATALQQAFGPLLTSAGYRQDGSATSAPTEIRHVLTQVVERVSTAMVANVNSYLDRLGTRLFAQRAMPSRWFVAPRSMVAIRHAALLVVAIAVTFVTAGAAALARQRTLEVVDGAPAIQALPKGTSIVMTADESDVSSESTVWLNEVPWPAVRRDSIVVEFRRAGFLPQNHVFVGHPLFVELQPVPQLMCGEVSASPAGVRITANSTPPETVDNVLSVCVLDGDSVSITFAKDGFRSKRSWFRGFDFDEELRPDSVAVRLVSNATGTHVTMYDSTGERLIASGRTPLETTVTPGRHRLTFEAPGYGTRVNEYDIEPSAQTQVIRNRYGVNTGVLRVWVDGGWAQVSINGGPQKLTAVTFSDLPVGRHVLQLSRPGVETVIDTVFVRALEAPGDTTRIRYQPDLSRKRS